MTRFLILFIVVFGLCGEVFPQFISNKGKSDETYLNYSGRNYENYSTAFIKKKFFDNFGNFLVEGTTVFEMNEVQQFVESSQSSTSVGNSSLLKSRYYQNYFNNLVIGKDAYSGFQTRLMVGDAIRTKFTDLTLNKARFNGIRWDAGTAKYRGTVVASRVSDPIRFSFDTGIYDEGRRRVRDWTQYLFGGHFESDFGDVLTVGATYVNQHQRRSSLDSKEASLKGVVTSVIPRMIYLRVSDDSPDDNLGPIIFGPPVVLLNGKAVPTVPMYKPGPSGSNMPTAASTTIEQPVQYYVLRNTAQSKGFDINLSFYNVSPVDTSLGTILRVLGGTGYSVPPPSYPHKIPGIAKENITYAYLIPEQVKSVQFQLILANDYKVETAQDYINETDSYNDPNIKFQSHANTEVTATPTPFFVRERAEGNVKDGSNKRVVIVNYGLATGMSVYGANFNFKYQGLEIQGEYNESVEYLKYPLLEGGQFEGKGTAYYIKGKKKFGRLTLGAEKYHIESKYSTGFHTYVKDNSYYGATATGASAPDYTGYDPSFQSTLTNINPGGIFFPLVDDNDDNDRWEDGFYYYNVTPSESDANRRNFDVINKSKTGDKYKFGYRQNYNELQNLGSIIRKPDTGIFPGKDKDNDGIPDDDRNADGLPDYSQDFLTFYSDPPSFDYGDDWNNNGVIDDQENDILPDYPYEPDIDGHHLFANLEILNGFNLTLGTIHQEAMTRGGENNVKYAKIFYSAETPRFGAIKLFYVLKHVRDNISNDGYQFKGVITARDPYPEYIEDPLNFRNSLVNSLYIGTKYTQIRNLNIENNVRIEFNNQFAIGTRANAFKLESKLLGDQIPGSLTYYGIVNKIDYTVRLFNNSFRIIPQIKVRTEKLIRNTEDKFGKKVLVVEESNQEIIPIFRIDYSVTENTDIRFGVQGSTLFGTSKFFTYRFRNMKDHVGDLDRSTMAISISNKSQFQGYNIVLDFGYKNTVNDYIRPVDRAAGTQESTLFFTIFAGLN
ncbi:MAG: hypothetical protein HYV28_04645 [Ignavibacteriales bacterium]|nr:hypothetical protein [Ignavibacteriales bacterium]